VVDELLAGGTPVVVEGGSGLYLRAVLGDLDFGSPPDEARRHVLEDLWRRAPEELVAELRARAPDVAARIDLQNGRRVIRALESLDVRPAQTDRLWSGEGRHAYRLFALDPGHDRAALETRIDRRVDDMLARGALEEVAAARAAGPLSRTAVQAIGVRELCAVLDGELSPAEAATRMKTRTRALARRQLTWMRKLPDAVRIPVAGRSPEVVGGDVLSLIG
jgi:tRNA dimethylallyltransferase